MDQSPVTPNNKFKTPLLALALAAFCFIGGWFLSEYRPGLLGGSQTSLNLAEFNRIYRLLSQNYDGEVSQVQLVEGAKRGFVEALGDPYTSYLSADEAKALSDDLSGTLSGIGAEIGIKSQQLQVVAPIPESPAAKAGLQPGDHILSINGADASGLSLDEAVAKIRGKEGTKVKLSLRRGEVPVFELTIIRQQITVKSVTWKLQTPGVGYINISRFGSDTAQLVETAGRELKEQGATKLVVDVRNNPGGYLEASVKVAEQFISDKLVVVEKKGGKIKEQLSTSGGGQMVGLPVVMLINSGSASASEILAGALQDHGAASLVGETSFGKGSVQEIRNLSAGAQLKITIAHWFTPKGRNISKDGIKPDVAIDLSSADYDAGRDPQLDKALEILAGR